MSSPRLPNFITFTGIDSAHDNCIEMMREISSHYPVEWGILVHTENWQTLYKKRYQSPETIKAILESAWKVDQSMRFALHYCGEDLTNSVLYNMLAPPRWVFTPCGNVRRVQLNGVSVNDHALTNGARLWARDNEVGLIVQIRNHFDRDAALVQQLADASGGDGIFPLFWPRGLYGTETGYAGGISADNVQKVVDLVGSQYDLDSAGYWLDMESSLRNEDDEFDFNWVWKVCKAVYGPPGGEGATLRDTWLRRRIS